MSEQEALNLPAFSPLTAEKLDEVIGDQLTIIRMVGKGGMGAVYKGQQNRLGRTVAVKVLPPLPSTEAWDFHERFMMEARAMARLDHPNIVKIHDFGETTNNLLYFVMEYVEGVELRNILDSGGLTVEHIGSWIPQVCEALEYAHNRELVHRDVKPGNIMVSFDGQVKIMDFGLVKMRTGPGRAGLTQARMSVGTPHYLAPEAIESGAHVDHRADIFSVGVVLYELLTGELPKGAWVPPSKKIPGLHPGFDELVQRALQPEPGDRFRRVVDLGRELLEIVAHQPDAGNRIGDFLPSEGSKAPLQQVRKVAGRLKNVLEG